MSHDPKSPTDAADHDRPFCAWIGGTCTGLRDCCDDRPPGFEDADLEDEEDEFECGAWINGKFDYSACTLAGTEDCDLECPESARVRGPRK